MELRRWNEPVHQLRLWIGLFCLAWGVLGFIGGTWFGMSRAGASASSSRMWYEDYADRFATEFHLSPIQKATMLDYLKDYHQKELRIRAQYAQEMERREAKLTKLGWAIVKHLCDNVLDEGQRRSFLDRIEVQQQDPSLELH